MVRRVRGQQGHECCFFPAGGIKVGGRCTGRAELGPQRQPRAAAASSSPTSSCWMRGCGHWEVASSVFPSNKLFLESVGCKPQPQILLSCIFFSQKRGPSRCGVAWGKDRRRHGGVWFQGFGLALLGSHHSLPGHWAPYPTQRHPVCRACVSPSLSSPEPHAVPQLKGFTCCKRDRQQSWD